MTLFYVSIAFVVGLILGWGVTVWNFTKNGTCFNQDHEDNDLVDSSGDEGPWEDNV